VFVAQFAALPRRLRQIIFDRSRSKGAVVKRGLNKEVLYRGLYSFAILCVCVDVTVLTTSTLTSVSAGQSATQEHPPAHPEFPAGEGRDTVLRLCIKCHSPNIILAYGQDRLGWENTITKMVRQGAEGTDEDFTDIADYLTDKFPPSTIQKIFVNMATDKQIAAVLDISLDDAKVIVAYRDQVKGFKSLEDMKMVPNVDTKKIDAKKDQLVFGAGVVKSEAK
jgi:competence protein ComEA